MSREAYHSAAILGTNIALPILPEMQERDG